MKEPDCWEQKRPCAHYRIGGLNFNIWPYMSQSLSRFTAMFTLGYNRTK